MPVAVDLHFTRQGEGPALLIAHGLYGNAANWSSHARRLAADFDVIQVDLRNHGRSPHDPDMSYPALAADLEALLDRLGLDSAVVLSHSMGGKAAMTLALRSPQRVRALIAADIAPVAYRHDHGEIIEAMRGLDLSRTGSRADADQALAASISSPMVRQFLLTNLQRGSTGYEWRIPLDILADQLPLIEGFPQLEGRYEGPALFVHGTSSDYVTAESEPAIRRHFPRAEIVPVEGAGHWLHVEKPEAFAERLDAFLATLSR